MNQESPTYFKCWLFTIKMRGLLQIMLTVVSNANGKTVKEISEATGIKPTYVELILGLLSDTGIVQEKDGRYYVDEETRGLCELMIEGVLLGLGTSLSG
jgi:transcription initiation factor IIE alpha subunit